MSYQELARTAAEQNWGTSITCSAWSTGEIARREDKSLERRIRYARFPLIKLDQFQWDGAAS